MATGTAGWKARWLPDRAAWLWGGAIGVVHFAVCYASMRFILTAWAVLAMWWCLGLIVGLFAAAPARAWVLMSIAAVVGESAAKFLINAHPEHTWWGPYVASLITPLAAVTGAGLARIGCAGLARWHNARPDLTRVRDVCIVELCCGVLAPVVAASGVRGIGLLTYGRAPRLSLFTSSTSHAIGCLILVPAILAITSVLGRIRHFRWRALAGGAAYHAAFAALVVLLFTAPAPPWALPVIPLLLLFPMLLGAAWYGPIGAVAMGVTLALITEVSTSRGLGPFVKLPGDFNDRIVASQVVAALSCVVSLLVAAVTSERSRLSRDLGSSRERLDLAVGGAQLGIWDWEIDNDRSYYSEQLIRLLGANPEGFDAEAFGWSRRLHDEDRPRVLNALQEHLEGGRIYDIEYRLRVMDGGYRWFRSSGRAVRNASGKPVRMIGTLMDVHERVTARQKLAESEALYRVLVEASGELVSLRDRDGKTVYISPSCERLFDASAAEIEAQDWRERIHPKDLPNLESLRARAFAGESVRGQYRAVNRHGQVFWMELCAEPVRDASGAVAYTLSVARDVTERVTQEQRLHESEQRYHALFDQGPVAFVVFRHGDLRILDANVAAEALYGYTRAELLSMSATQLRPAEDVPKFLQRLKDESTPPPPAGWRHKRKDGSTFLVELTGRDVVINGERARLVLVTDVTEVRRARQALSEQNRILERIAGDTPLQQILDEIVLAVEAIEPPLRGSICLLEDDGQTFRSAAAPCLPAEYSRALNGLRIGPSVGSCGTAMWRHERVITEDIQADPLWNGFADLAAAHGLAACWSEPILNSQGAVLGSLAIYSPTPARPSQQFIEIMASSAHLAGIAVERRRLEAALTETEQRFRALFQQASVGIMRLSPSGRFLMANPVACQILGRSAEDLSGRSFTEFTHPEDVERNLGTLRESLADGDGYTLEKRYLRPDGTQVWASVAVRIVRDARGQPDYLVSAIQDITGRVEARRQLAESEERYRLLAETIDEVFWMTDARAQRAIYLSPAFDRVWGVPRETVQADLAAFYATIHPDDRDAVRAEMDRVRQSGPGTTFDHRYRIVRPDGAVRWIRDRGRVLADPSASDKSDAAEQGSGRFQVGLAEDVTESVEASLRLTESEQKFRMLTELSQDFVAHFDLDGRRMYRSPAILRVFGFDADELTRTDSLLRVHPDDAEITTRAREAVLRGEPSRIAFRAARRDGQYLWIDMRVEPVKGPNGEVLSYISYGRDITELRAAQEEARRAEARYRDFIVQSTEGIWRAVIEPPIPISLPADEQVQRMFRDATIVECNAAMSRMYGIDSPEEFLGRAGAPIRDLLPPSDPRNVEYLRAFVDAGHALVDAESHEITPSGEARVFLNSLRAIFDESGRHIIGGWGLQRDVTERNAAQAALAASEERFRRLLTDVRVVAWQADPQTRRFTFVGGRAEHILGYPPERWLEPEFWPSALHPDDRDRTLQFCLGETAAGRDHEFEYRAIRSDGSTVWLRDIVSVEVRDGKPVMLRGVIVDLTEQRAAEHALRESQATNVALLSALPDLLFRVDAQGTYISYHAPSGTVLLAPPEKFLGRTMREILPSEIAEPGMRAVTAAIATDTIQTYEYQTLKGDRRHWWECRVVRAAPSEALIVVRDVTHRREAEEALRDSQRRFSLLINQSPIGVIVWNTRFEVAQWNPSAERIFGFTQQEAVGKHADLIVPPEVRPAVDELWRALMGQRGGTHAINENLTRSGERIVCEWHNSPLVGADGAVIGVSSFVQDVTERVMSERRQALMMQELDHRVKNNMAAVLSLAEQTGRTSANMDQFQATFMGRVRALARMHTALASSRWRGADLRLLVRQAIEAYCGSDESRVTLHGPAVTLPPRAAQSMAMAFNELATNAAKYGAFSDPAGTVRVSWSYEAGPNKDIPTLSLSWIERNGPAATPPKHRGLGIELIEGAVIHQLGGSVNFRFPPDGLECVLSAPIDLGEAMTPISVANGVR